MTTRLSQTPNVFCPSYDWTLVLEKILYVFGKPVVHSRLAQHRVICGISVDSLDPHLPIYVWVKADLKIGDEHCFNHRLL